MNAEIGAMEIDQVLATKMFEEYAVLVITGVPRGTQFGIDLCEYTTDENFRGVKMIPPGFHYVWCAAQGNYGDAAPRVGFVHFFTRKEIIVREWDAATEELRERQIPEPELEKQRIREHLHDLDRYLAPYDIKFWKDWSKYTHLVTEALVARCRPALGTIRTNVELQSCPDAERPRGNNTLCSQMQNLKNVVDENELLPNLKPIEGTAPRFTDLPERVPKDATPGDVSMHSMDCIEAIDKLMEQLSWQELLGEIQLSFVFFLVGHSVESLAHWRRLLNLLSNSETAVQKYKILYVEYCATLIHQLPLLPEELMEPTEHNTVYKDVRKFLYNLHMQGLSRSAERLAKSLQRTMRWSFHGLLDEDPDDLPVVVDT